MKAPRVAESLNLALHAAFRRHGDLFLLGEDVVDPYGGAFKVTTGLSTAYPERVLSTPLSEGGIVGVANGLAMTGHRVVVELMFGDFISLAFDQILNFSAKSVSMYGTRRPMPVVVRCPVGGRRGYGPTHSQSPQKHLIGIPDLALYELSPFHDVDRMLGEILNRDAPAVLFEDKVLYTERVFPGGSGDAEVQMERLDGWAHLRVPGRSDRTAVALVTPGGVGRRGLAAMRALAAEGIDVHLLVPDRLYPLEVSPVLDLILACEAVWVAEESTAGGTWGAEVAREIHEVAWDRLRAPVRSLSSADSIIPAAPHLERHVLLQTESIVDAVRAGLAERTPTSRTSRVPLTPEPQPTPDDVPDAGLGPTRSVVVPKLNNNDDSYVLIEWLVPHGGAVVEGQTIAEVETSKAVEELVAATLGTLQHMVPAGDDCRPGQVIGHITATDVDTLIDPGRATPFVDRPSLPGETSGFYSLPVSQQQVAKVVTLSHREIPAAFAVVRVDVDAALAAAESLSMSSGADIGLAELTIKAIGELHDRFPLLFGSLESHDSIRLAPSPAVGVTVDVGNGLSIPVVRDVVARTVEEIADELTGLRMRALRGRLTEQDLSGASIALSLNMEDGVVHVQPIIPPGLAAIVSLPSVQVHATPTVAGGLRDCHTLDIGLAHDHRFVNGRDASDFLRAVKELLEAPASLTPGEASLTSPGSVVRSD